MLICGIDEAGRGPVLGPLVMAGVLIDEKKTATLKQIGVKDSKQLITAKRDELFSMILSIADEYSIVSLTPKDVDDALNDPKNNLNKLEATASSRIINELKPKRVYIDLPDKNPMRYKSFIRKDLKDKSVTLIAEHKADDIYPVVSAASILAKVTRDRYIEMLKEQIGVDFGSGYMSDPKTQKFLKERWNDKNIHFFRKSWSSWQVLKQDKDQRRLFDF